MGSAHGMGGRQELQSRGDNFIGVSSVSYLEVVLGEGGLDSNAICGGGSAAKPCRLFPVDLIYYRLNCKV